MSTYKSGRHGQIRSAHTGTKGSNSITLKYGNGRSDTFFGAPKGQPPIGKGHGHTVKYGGFPVHSRQPGNKKRQQKSAWDLFYRI